MVIRMRDKKGGTFQYGDRCLWKFVDKRPLIIQTTRGGRTTGRRRSRMNSEPHCVRVPGCTDFIRDLSARC